MGIDPENPPQQPGAGEPQPPGQPYQPPQPYQQPPPYQPPQQPYNPPPDSYQQSPGGGQQFTGGAYNPPPGYQSAPPPAGKAKGGFNWLLCCGISCGVLLLLGVLVFAVTYKSIKGFVGSIQQMEGVSTEVGSTDIQTIVASATPIDVATLVASPDTYSGQWLAVTGVVSPNQQMASQGASQGTGYYLEGGLIVTDVSSNPAVALAGETVVAYGQITMMDFSKFPFMAAMMEEAAKTDPEVAGMFKDGKMLMFVAKEVQPADGTVPQDPSSAGWGE